MAENSLQRLNAAGQSIWLDFIDRTILRNGDLQRRIRDDALTGMTSNPSIFEKALAEGSTYDDQIRSAEADLTAMELFELIATTDVRIGVRRVCRRARADARRGWVRVDRGVTRRGERCARDDLRGFATLGDGRSPQRDDQGSGNGRGREGGSAAHGERRQRQHHAVVRDRRVQGGDRRVHGGPRGSHRGRQADRCDPLGGELLREPRRQRSGQASRRRGENVGGRERPRRHCTERRRSPTPSSRTSCFRPRSRRRAGRRSRRRAQQCSGRSGRAPARRTRRIAT